MISVLGLWVHLNIFGTHILNIFTILPTGHIVIAFRRTFKMCPFFCPLGILESHGWAHSKYTQHVPTGHIGVTWQGIFKMYSTFNHWAHRSHMLTALSMFSPCTQWVFGPLSPVSAGHLSHQHDGNTSTPRCSETENPPSSPKSPYLIDA